MIIIQKYIHFLKAGCLSYKMVYNNVIFENVFFYFCPPPGPLCTGCNFFKDVLNEPIDHVANLVLFRMVLVSSLAPLFILSFVPVSSVSVSPVSV